MKVCLIGAGPGDPGLLTLRGRELLAQADVLIYDALANPDLLSFAKPGAELVYVGKVAGRHALPQDEINELLARKAREGGGRLVARLKGGDPYVFGRGGEEAEYLAARNIPFEEVPGVSSAIAAPAYAGIPLTHRGFTSSLTILTGHERPDKAESAHNWRALAQSGSTLVFLMGMKNLPFIAASLIENGLDPATPAAVIHRGTTPMQRCLSAPLAELPEAARTAGLTNPAVIVIGKVVSLRDKLDWFSQKPLLGRRIVISRAREQASALAARLSALGAAVIQCPAIEIRPVPDYAVLDAAIGCIESYDWLIFTSANGVKYFWERLLACGRDARSLHNAKIAAIGPGTARSLQEKGIRPDLVPPLYVAESAAESIIALEGGSMGGCRVLIPRAAEARMALPDLLVAAGALVDIASAYETIPARDSASETRALLEEGALDCISFASSSTVRNFLELIPAELLARHPETALAVIGPVTEKTLNEAGLQAVIRPDNYDIPGLVDAIVAWFAKKGEFECR